MHVDVFIPFYFSMNASLVTYLITCITEGFQCEPSVAHHYLGKRTEFCVNQAKYCSRSINIKVNDSKVYLRKHFVDILHTTMVTIT